MRTLKNTFPGINKTEESISVDFSSLFESLNYPNVSPIDEYYSNARHLIISSNLPEVKDNEIFMRLLVLELVSSAELYFRRVISGIINVCPVSRLVASKRSLTFGSLSYYKKNTMGYALLDGVSLSSEADIKKYTNNIIGVEIKPNSSASVALASFEKVCQIRHIIVHSKGEAGEKNISELILKLDAPSKLKITTINFQALVVVTHNAIRSYNSFVFECIVKNWKKSNLLVGKWKNDRRLFNQLLYLMNSNEDNPEVNSNVFYNNIWNNNEI